MEYMKSLTDIKDSIAKVIIGKDEIIDKVLAAILAGGHILLEDIPGVGKTTLALAFSKVLGLEFSRLQFNPDIVPSDITGFSIYDRDTKEFSYRKGAAMCNFFLADEINRTSSKTQSALLEIMEEGQISIDGNVYDLPKPFIVMATQNPFGMAGTQKLPEAQLDRFMIKLSMGYPDVKSQINILKDREGSNPLDQVRKVLSAEELEEIKNSVSKIFVDSKIYEYIANIVEVTRNMDDVSLGVSPRGALALAQISKATALINGRDFVIPSDVVQNLEPVLSHRIFISHNGRVKGMTVSDVIKQINETVVAPKIDREI